MRIKKIYLILGLGFLLRLFLSGLGTLELDYHTFVAWSNALYRDGLQGFYENNWSDYLPGYLYVLYLLRHASSIIGQSEFLYKLPAILADVATSYLIYKIIKKFKPVNDYLARIGAVLYLFNPAIIANSTLWGQVDSLTAFFSLLAIYLYPNLSLLSALSLGLGIAIKPQAGFASLVILYQFFQLKNKKYINIFLYALLSALIVLISFVPFTDKNLLVFAWKTLESSLSQYPYTSVNAFNFWGGFGMWQSDTNGLISARMMGFFLSGIYFILAILESKKLNKNFKPYFLLSTVMLAVFMFFTRIHERHLLPVLAPLAVLSVFQIQHLVLYISFSLIYILNLYYAYVWINNDFLKIIPDLGVVVLSFLGVGLSLLLIYIHKIKITLPKRSAKKFKFTELNYSSQKINYLLFLVLFSSFILRIYSLGQPPKEYFDEVYHAFTARRVLHGDPKAWEWWNPHPKGYAYEWTHPPFAKLIMAGSMSVFGEKPFSWRLPATLAGLASTYLIFSISRLLFKDELAALFGAAIFALDGLNLVMSRIGMNDIYLLLFVLLSFYLFLKDKILFSSIALGLAGASKWSVVWALPLFGVSFFALDKKFNWRYFWFFVLPPLVYLASYYHFFVSGHNFKTFIDLQKQMWWYHTRLDATHAYTSPWWSWPLMLRPIWLYTSSSAFGKVSNIYAMGNPIVFWFGLVSAIVSLVWAYVYKYKKLGLVLFGYFVFFVSWAASPRIMFLYHFLPSTAFMSILAGVVLRKIRLLYALAILLTALCVLVYFYPHLTGMAVPISLDKSYYWISSWR